MITPNSASAPIALNSKYAKISAHTIIQYSNFYVSTGKCVSFSVLYYLTNFIYIYISVCV